MRVYAYRRGAVQAADPDGVPHTPVHTHDQRHDTDSGHGVCAVYTVID